MKNGCNIITKIRSAVLLFLAAMSLPGLSACSPLSIASFGADAAYTNSEVRSVEQVYDDNRLVLALNKALLAEDAGLFKDVSSVVYKGRVYLLGTVDDAARKQLAGRLGNSIGRTRSVINLIQVSDGGGIGGLVDDAVLVRRIQTELLFDNAVRSANYRIRSVNGVVYIIGQAHDAAELAKVRNILRGFEDVRRVEEHVVLQPAR